MRDSLEGLKPRGISRLDVLLAVIVLALSAGGIWWVQRGRGEESGGPMRAKVYRGDALLLSVGLEQDRSIDLLDGRIRAQVRGGRIAITESDCPRRVCVHIGSVGHSGETIICVPNKILIEIEAEGGAEALDAVVY